MRYFGFLRRCTAAAIHARGSIALVSAASRMIRASAAQSSPRSRSHLPIMLRVWASDFPVSRRTVGTPIDQSSARASDGAGGGWLVRTGSGGPFRSDCARSFGLRRARRAVRAKRGCIFLAIGEWRAFVWGMRCYPRKNRAGSFGTLGLRNSSCPERPTALRRSSAAFSVLPCRRTALFCVLNFRFAPLLFPSRSRHVNWVKTRWAFWRNQDEELSQDRSYYGALFLGACIDETFGARVGDAGFVTIVNVEKPRVDAVFEQRKVRRVLDVIADVPLVIVNRCLLLAETRTSLPASPSLPTRRVCGRH